MMLPMNSSFSCELRGGRDSALRFRVEPVRFRPPGERFDVLRCVPCGLGAKSVLPVDQGVEPVHVAQFPLVDRFPVWAREMVQA